MSIYGWLITKDHIGNGADDGATGPQKITKTHADNLVQIDCTDPTVGVREMFKMYDDDGVLYYTGFITGEYDGFEPLDDFGTPNAGCTEIRYRLKGSGAFETL